MKCPNCVVVLDITEYLDYEAINSEKLEVSVCGFCPSCGRKFLWTQDYTLTNEDELEDDD